MATGWSSVASQCCRLAERAPLHRAGGSFSSQAWLLAVTPSHCWHEFPAFLVERMASESYLLCLWCQLVSSHVAVCVRPELETRDSSRAGSSLSPPPRSLWPSPSLVFGMTESSVKIKHKQSAQGGPGNSVYTMSLTTIYLSNYGQTGS